MILEHGFAPVLSGVWLDLLSSAMAQMNTFVVWLSVARFLAYGAPTDETFAPGSHKHTIHINITDPSLGAYTRTYHAFVPPQCQKGHSCPLLLWFHGWCDDPLCPGCGWLESGEQNGHVGGYLLQLLQGCTSRCRPSSEFNW